MDGNKTPDIQQLLMVRETYRKASQEETKNWSAKKKRRIVARAMLNMRAFLPEPLFEKLSQLLPEIDRNMTVEEMITIGQIYKAIVSGDTLAANSLLDSAYGRVSTDESEVETYAVQPMTREKMQDISKELDSEY